MNISKLQNLIQSSKLNNAEIAERCDISPTTLYNLLGGADAKISTVEKLAKVLNCKVGYLFDETGDDTELDFYRREVERLKTLLESTGAKTTKVVVEIDVDDDEFIKMGLKDKVIRVLNRK